MIRLTTTAILISVASSAVNAASFDCDKASKPDEKAICADRTLNDADVRMTTMFDLAVDMVAMGERDSLRAAQKTWLEQRTSCGGDMACLNAAYDRRVTDLRKHFVDLESRAAE